MEKNNSIRKQQCLIYGAKKKSRQKQNVRQPHIRGLARKTVKMPVKDSEIKYAS